ncbi:hypothetical protein LP52_03810 [Streptomonospora alba]|uniref:ESX-1 secretion-associated protein n=1 Tax=Streptomonospora alba TaxID=183763 RepID=A0A0C2JM86_9ACTN|nr:DUF6507 family protein [Streptomonospora alba]KII00066.1 hypothetical protein LP52_03810 [Streptomonospora alba]
MSNWDVSPEGVNSVLTTVGGHVGDEAMTEGLTGQIDDFGTHVENASEQAASAPIGQALQEFVDHFGPMMWTMVARTSSAVTAGSEATTAYIDGDLEMAADAQANAGDISDLEF